jgi:hypothetical protein
VYVEGGLRLIAVYTPLAANAATAVIVGKPEVVPGSVEFEWRSSAPVLP